MLLGEKAAGLCDLARSTVLEEFCNLPEKDLDLLAQLPVPEILKLVGSDEVLSKTTTRIVCFVIST